MLPAYNISATSTALLFYHLIFYPPFSIKTTKSKQNLFQKCFARCLFFVSFAYMDDTVAAQITDRVGIILPVKKEI